jgi:5'(3')-deoxyribonucleotidase
MEKMIRFAADGVLFDFDGRFKELTGVSYDLEIPMTEEEKIKKWSLLDSHPNFFLELPWIPGSRTMLGFTMKYAKHAVGILSSATRHIPQSAYQKYACFKREIPWLPDSNVIVVERKHDKLTYANSESILVDDFSVNINSWKLAGGHGILFKNPIQAMIELQEIIQAPVSLFNKTLEIIKNEYNVKRSI